MVFLVLDANVLIAALDVADSCHEQAAEVIAWLLTVKKPHKIVIPKVCVAETVLTLKSNGLEARYIEEALRKFVDQPYVVILDVSETQIHKFAGPIQKRRDGESYMRTNDYMIGVLARILDGTILTFDKGLPKICTFAHTQLCGAKNTIERLAHICEPSVLQ